MVESFSVLHIMMEYAGHGTLHAKIRSEGPYPEEQARHAFAQLAAGIHYMVSRRREVRCSRTKILGLPSLV